MEHVAAVGIGRPAETAVTRVLPALAAALVATPALLAVPTDGGPLAIFTAQLSVMVVLGLVTTWRIADLAGEEWFIAAGWGDQRRRFGGVVVLVVIPTGIVALVSLASSAALRLDVSLQFLQLLFALDIA